MFINDPVREPDDFHPDGLPGDVTVAQAAYAEGRMDGLREGRKMVLNELHELGVISHVSYLALDQDGSR